MSNPLVSVIMPVYNSEEYLDECINSILNQTLDDFEFIIVEDSSTDNSLKILKEYEKSDDRINVIQNRKNLGVTESINKGIKNSKGSFIARIDSDDYCKKDRFKKQIDLLKKTNSDICSTNVVFVDENSKPFAKRKYDVENIDDIIKFESPIAHGTVMLKREIFEIYGLFKFEYAQDYDYWLRLWSKDCDFILLDEYSYFYRQHKSANKFLKTKKLLKATLKVKIHAMKNYNVRFGFRGWSRIIAESSMILLPKPILLKLFYFLKGNA